MNHKAEASTVSLKVNDPTLGRSVGVCCGERAGEKKLLHTQYFLETKIDWDKNTGRAIVSDYLEVE